MAKIKQCDKCKTTTDVNVWKMRFPLENCSEDLEVLIVGDNAEKVTRKEK